MADQIEKVKRQNEKKAAEKAAAAAASEKAATADVIDEIAKEADAEMKELQVSILSKADLSLAYTREEYKEKLDKLQAKIEKLTGSCTAGGSRSYSDSKDGMPAERAARSNV